MSGAEAAGARFGDLHLDWDAGLGPGRGLAEALRAAIGDGRLGEGTVLPSTRALAADLGVARGTVTAVYEQLAIEGYLRTRQGALPVVATVGAARSGAAPPRQEPERPQWSMVPGIPDMTSFPRAAWLAATRRVLAAAPAADLGYGDTAGHPALRRALATYLARARGVRARPERVVICAGYAHALVCLARLFRECAFENPSLGVHRDLVTGAGVAVRGIPVDGDGARVGEIDAPLAVLTPAHQYPLGHTLAPARRAELAELVRSGSNVVVEDDYDGEFRFDRQPVGAVQALAPEHVVYAGTVSKTLAPGMRLGWLVLPERLVEPVTAGLRATGRTVPVLEQLVFAELLERGDYDRHVRRCRTAYRRRRDRLLETLAPYRETLAVTGVSAGLHLAVLLPDDGPGEAELLAAFGRHSLRVHPLRPHWLGEPRAQGCVLGYAEPAEHAYSGTLDALRAGLHEVLG